MYYGDCTSNHYVYVQANTYNEDCIHLIIMYMLQANIYYGDCTSNHYVYVTGQYAL